MLARRRAARAALGAAIGLALAVGYLGLRETDLVDAVEAHTVALRFVLRGPVPAPPHVAILAIDDRTIAELRRWPLPRRVIAEAVQRLADAGAAAVGLDLLLLEPEPSTDGNVLGPGDAALYRALGEAGNVVLAVALSQTADPPEQAASIRVVRARDEGAGRSVLRAPGALLPLAAFREHAGLGHVNVPVDSQGRLQRLHLAIGVGDDYVPALPLELARRFLKLAPEQVELVLGEGVRLGDRFVPTDARLRMPLGYYGAAGSIATHSLSELLNGRLAPEAVRGRIVLIGATAVGVGDTFATAYSDGLPGVEALATAAANLAGGRILDRSIAVVPWDLAGLLLMALAGMAAARIAAPSLALLALLLLAVGWLAFAQAMFGVRLTLVNVTFPLLALLLSAGVIAGLRSVDERRVRGDLDRQRRNLARTHSPVMAQFLAEDAAAAAPEREQPAAILFIDLAGFTRFSERRNPADTARFLRQFHGHIERAVTANRGVLQQFTGDGALVVFGLPAPRADDAVAALACARDLVREMADWGRELAGQGEGVPRFGIGIHYGPVAMARLGGAEQIQFSVAGDTVNVASRLEALSRLHNAVIVVSDGVVEAVHAAGQERLLVGFVALPPQQIRGREGRIPVWIIREAALAAG